MKSPKIAKGAWVIDVRPYQLQIAVFTNQDRAIEQLSHEGDGREAIDNANALSCFVNNHAGCYLWCYMPADSAERTIVHEAVHLAGMVFRMIGARYDAENDEPFAYLVDSIYTGLCQALEKPEHNGKPKLID